MDNGPAAKAHTAEDLQKAGDLVADLGEVRISIPKFLGHFAHSNLNGWFHLLLFRFLLSAKRTMMQRMENWKQKTCSPLPQQ